MSTTPHPDVARIEAAAAAPLNGDKPASRLGDLLDEVAGLIDKFVTLPREGLSVLIACWIASTYTYTRVSYCGYLALRSATPRCGKSRLLQLVALLSQGEPPVTGTPSAALLVRRTRPVMVLDEVDRLRNVDAEGYGEVIAVLNIGYDASGCYERLEPRRGGGWEPRRYEVYGPIAMAGIEALADTLADRAYQVRMQRSTRRMPRLSRRRLAPDAARIRDGLTAWAERHGETITRVYDGLPDEVPDLAGYDDRLQDISEPLVVLATMADAERPTGAPILPRLLAGLRAAAGRREPSNRERELAAMLSMLDDRMPAGAEELWIGSAELLTACAESPDLVRIGSARSLAAVMRHLDLAARQDVTRTHRGYAIRRTWLEEWRGRYRTAPEGEV